MSLKLLISMTKSLPLDVYETPGRIAEFRKEPARAERPYRARPTTSFLNEAATHLVPDQAPRGAAMTEWYFVWVEGLRGPMPQKWSSDGLWGQVGRQDVIVRFALDDAEAHLSLDELARLHPIPDGR
ncbi:hypothetical protein [Bradyrhizobium sp. AZCC 1693]|uniref:hypothetical protein n=1 Tax=Bradyrhizobium sp. AZCC 1693 TaxID=3117029 RepID=UPI002FF36F02